MTEKAGKADEVTSFDEDFEGLCFKVDQIKLVTERMLSQVEAMVQPNPSELCVCWSVFTCVCVLECVYMFMFKATCN